MKRINSIILLSITLTMLCIPVQLWAQQTLFSLNESKSVEFETSKSEYISRTAVSIFKPQELSENDEIQFEIPGGELGIYRVIRVTEFLPGVISVSAKDTQNRHRYVTANWTENGRFLINVNHYDTGETYHLRYESESQTHFLASVDSRMADILECSEEMKNPLPNLDDTFLQKNERSSDLLNAPSKLNLSGQSRYTANESGSTTIDVLLVYTDSAENWANGPENGGLDNVVAQMMNLSQLALDNSQIPITLRVVGLRNVGYDADGSNMTVGSGDHLRRLTASPDFNPFGTQYGGFMNEIHEWREELGADMVSALMEVNDVGGVAWVGSGPAPSPYIMFSVNRIQQMASSYTFIHELGHNLGSLHSRNQSSGVAGLFGGAFEYATGWRFSGSGGMSYATVMTYAEGSERIPYFSNPNVIFDGTPTGSYSGFYGPSDAARTFKNTAPYVAGIYSTRFEPPALNVDDNEISVVMAPDESQTITLSLSNLGESNLYFRPEIRPDAIANTGSEPVFNPDWKERNSENTVVQFPGIGVAPLWGSSFNEDAGFIAGEVKVQNDWPVLTRNQSDFYRIETTEDNDQMVRVVYQPHREENEFMGVRSAYDRFFQYGAYRFNAEMRINNPDEATYYIHLLDTSEQNKIQDFAWMLFEPNGTISFVKQLNTNGSWVVEGSDVEWVADEFKTVEILYSPEDNGVHFLYDNQLVGSTTPLSGDKPLAFQAYRANTNDESTADFSEVFLTMVYEGLEYVKATPETGNVQPGNTEMIQLKFDTDGLQQGSYLANLEIYTNDAENELVTIPINLEVTGSVSVPNQELPKQATLSQNYPNPFNPVTNIEFQLPESGEVTLDVFNIAGQQVQRLVSGTLNSGSHIISFDGSGLSSGMYVYRLQTNSGVFTRKMMLLK